MVMYLTLSNGMQAAVDDDVYRWTYDYKWQACEGRHGHFYAQTAWPIGLDERGKVRSKMRQLQRVVLDPNDFVDRWTFADHIDFDTLNNTRSNLRWTTKEESSMHRRPFKNKTGYKGVSRKPRAASKPFRAWLRKDGVAYTSPYFATPEEAALAYNEMAIQHHGEFAVLNVLQTA